MNTFIVVSLFVTAVVIYYLAPILTPFLAAAILAYLADPLVRRLMRLHLPRIVSVIIVFLILCCIIILLILLLIPQIEKQIGILIEVTPRIISWFQANIIPWLNEKFGIQAVINVDTLKTSLAENWSKAGGIAAWLGTTLLHSGFALVEWLVNLVLIPVVTFYLLLDWDKVIKGIRGLIPRKVEPTLVKLARECDDVLSAFFRGQLLVMLSLGIIYSLGLTLIGLKVGLVIGLFAGLLSIVPYLGFIAGIVTASIVAFVQYGTITSVFLVWVVFMIGQILEGTLLTPKLVGNRIGLHPVAVIFAILAGGTLFGFFGILLALPVAAVIMVLIRFLTKRYRHSQFYQ